MSNECVYLPGKIRDRIHEQSALQHMAGGHVSCVQNPIFGWGKIKDQNGQINEVLYKERIDTCARVGEDIWRNVKEVHTQISLNTAKVYTNNAKVKHYGHNHLADHGDLGRSEYIWTNERGTAPLNEEELKILQECAATAYGKVDVLIAAIDDDYKNGVLTKEERDAAVGAIETADSYDLFVDLVIKLCISKTFS